MSERFLGNGACFSFPPPPFRTMCASKTSLCTWGWTGGCRHAAAPQASRAAGSIADVEVRYPRPRLLRRGQVAGRDHSQCSGAQGLHHTSGAPGAGGCASLALHFAPFQFFCTHASRQLSSSPTQTRACFVPCSCFNRAYCSSTTTDALRAVLSFLALVCVCMRWRVLMTRVRAWRLAMVVNV